MTAATTRAPRRVQRTRRKGQPGMPPGAIYVGRGPGCKWGNPFKIGAPIPFPYCTFSIFAGVATVADARMATLLYALRLRYRVGLIDLVREELAGRDLACWCAEGTPCHGDLLLLAANTPLEQVDQALARAIADLIETPPEDEHERAEEP
jgi:hypothetical protein